MNYPYLYQKVESFQPMKMMISAAYVLMEGISYVVMDAPGLFT